MQTVVLSCTALSLDAQAHFAAMYLSRSPCCHAAVVRSTHYFVSCDSISESFGPGSWTKRREGGTSQPPLNSDDRESEQKQSPRPSMDYIRKSTNVNHALISAVLQRLFCRKIGTACEAAHNIICFSGCKRAYLCVRLCNNESLYSSFHHII